MVKLFTNGILATKVMFCNEVYQMCQKLGISYEDIRSIACLDERVGPSHTHVPGPDGDFGVGGHCLPKDLNNLRFVAHELGVSEQMLTAVLQRNDELRKNRDWEQMKGRAVVD